MIGTGFEDPKNKNLGNFGLSSGNLEKAGFDYDLLRNTIVANCFTVLAVWHFRDVEGNGTPGSLGCDGSNDKKEDDISEYERTLRWAKGDAEDGGIEKEIDNASSYSEDKDTNALTVDGVAKRGILKNAANRHGKELGNLRV